MVEGHLPVALGRRLVGAGHLQDERVAASLEHRLHPGDEGGEERVGIEDGRRPLQHETDRVRPLAREAATAQRGHPAEPLGHGEDAGAGLPRDARAVVEGGRDGGDGDLGLGGDIEDRDSERTGRPPCRHRSGQDGTSAPTGPSRRSSGTRIISPPTVRRSSASLALRPGGGTLAQQVGGEDLGVVLRLVAEGAGRVLRPPGPGVPRDAPHDEVTLDRAGERRLDEPADVVGREPDGQVALGVRTLDARPDPQRDDLPAEAVGVERGEVLDGRLAPAVVGVGARRQPVGQDAVDRLLASAEAERVAVEASTTPVRRPGAPP